MGDALVDDTERIAKMGRIITRYRERRRMSLGELAKDTNMALTTLIRLERGQFVNPGVLHIARLAHRLGVTMDVLLSVGEDC